MQVKVWFTAQNAEQTTPTTPTTAPTAAHPSTKKIPQPYRHYEYRYHHHEHHTGSGIGLLIAGLFIILIGASALFGWGIWQYIWSLIIVLVGVWIIMWGLRCNRRYRQGSPQ